LEQKPDSERSEEHVIPAALGGTWTVMNVCKVCQERANIEIDRPFTQSLWVLEQRHRLRIPDRYGNVPDAPRVRATVADGRTAVVTLNPGGWKLDLPPSSRSGAGGGALQITVSVDDEADYIAKKIKRFERDNPGFTWQITKRQIVSDAPLDVSFPFSIPLTLWPRFAVKVALTVGRELYGEEWLRSDHGLLLHRLLWNEEQKVRMNPLPTKSTIWAGLGWTPPPNHVFVTVDSYGAPMLLITLFGEDTYGVPLGAPAPPGGAAWVLHTHGRTWERLSADDFITRIVAATAPPALEPTTDE
jgi:HNH endonuclease